MRLPVPVGRPISTACCHDSGQLVTFYYVTFEEFAVEHGPRIRAGLVFAFGPEAGLDGASEALTRTGGKSGRVCQRWTTPRVISSVSGKTQHGA